MIEMASVGKIQYSKSDEERKNEDSTDSPKSRHMKPIRYQVSLSLKKSSFWDCLVSTFCQCCRRVDRVSKVYRSLTLENCFLK